MNAGVTTIGNLGQYFTFQLPGWKDDIATTRSTLTAIGLMAAQPVEVMVHSNLDDGFAAVFQDLASALGADVVAVDLSDEKLALAAQLGAVAGINARSTPNISEAVRDLTDGGAHVSVDAIGNADVCFNSINSLRKRGRHIQVGLLVGAHSQPVIPMANVLSNELEIIGSHGMQAYRYAEMIAMIVAGKLMPQKLIGQTISLKESVDVLTSMGDFDSSGVTVITEF